MPRLYTDSLYDLMQAATILNPANAGAATGTSSAKTLRNDMFSLFVIGSGLVTDEEAGRFAGFSAGRITGLEFRYLTSDGGSVLRARIDGLDLGAATLDRSGFDSLLATNEWDIHPLGQSVALELYGSVIVADVTLRGSDGDDTLEGNIGADLIRAGAGADYVGTLEGNDTVYGEAGNDTIRLGANPEDVGGAVAYGGAGDDQIVDVLLAFGGAGKDALWTETGKAYGGDGADQVTSLTGSAYGGSGNDHVWGGESARIYGGDGNDRLDAKVGATIYGGDGDDRMILRNNIIGQTEVTHFYGGAGNDVFRPESDRYGSGTSDRAQGGAGRDTLYGLRGADTLTGGNGDDALYGGADDDRLSGGAGHDVMTGDAGNDHLFSGTGEDALTGGTGNDTLSGGIGNDTLTGEAGDDNLRGGAGADLFLFGTGFGSDRVFDFDANSDRLQFTVEMGAESTAEGVRLTSRLDGSAVVLVGADLSDVDGVHNVYLL